MNDYNMTTLKQLAKANDHAHTANLIAYLQTFPAEDIDGAEYRKVEDEVRQRLGLAPLHRPDDTDGAADPASENFEDQVNHLAAQLWKADPKNNTPARSFAEDYGDAQDRYRHMARFALDPTAGKDAQR